MQILTVHAAKGLEWQVVAVPHLSGRVFPSTASTRTWLTDAGDLPPLLRGDRATVSEHGVPVLDTSDVNDRKRLSDKISDHKRCLEQRRIDEERRLLYVAITRAEDTLLLSGHHWGASEAKPRGPSDFLCELKDIIETSEAAGDPCGVVEHWAPTPPDGEPNPLRDRAVEALWPADPAGAQRRDVDNGAAMVTQAMSGGLDCEPARDVDGWAADVDALLRRARHRVPPASRPSSGLPAAAVGQHAWWSSAATPTGSRNACAGGCRPGLTLMPCWAPHFTTGCSGSFTPSGCSTSTTCPAPSIATPATPKISPNCRPRSRCRPGPPARPIDVEVPFEMVIGGTVVRGRIDAIFADDDGGTTVVDWKTGEPPDAPEAKRYAAVQLAVYRLAWAQLHGCPVESVRAAFHYVRSGRTVTPESLPGADDLVALLERGRLGVAVDRQRRSDHRDLQRQTGDRAEPHDQGLAPPQPDQVDVSGKHPDEHGDRRQRAKLAGARR